MSRDKKIGGNAGGGEFRYYMIKKRGAKGRGERGDSVKQRGGGLGGKINLYFTSVYNKSAVFVDRPSGFNITVYGYICEPRTAVQW